MVLSVLGFFCVFMCLFVCCSYLMVLLFLFFSVKPFKVLIFVSLAHEEISKVSSSLQAASLFPAWLHDISQRFLLNCVWLKGVEECNIIVLSFVVLV